MLPTRAPPCRGGWHSLRRELLFLDVPFLTERPDQDGSAPMVASVGWRRAGASS